MIRGCGYRKEASEFDVVSAEQTVAEVARDPRALAVLESMGIDQCCGASLSLAEAAAAAGVPLTKLLDALHAVKATSV
jgi:iron-sulfur cluster repair protein YtfE (RIC family)